MRKFLKRIRKKSGATLVEMIVSLVLIELLMIMVMGIVGPAAKMFVRIQRLEFAQMIVDNVAEEIKSQVQNSVDFIRIYGGNDLQPADSGKVLEFMNTEGYVVLMSTEGCEDTSLIRGSQPIGTSGAQEAGRLLMRYYWPDIKESGLYTYNYRKNGTPVARTVNSVFSGGYYMGNYLKVQFRFLPSEGEGVTCLAAEISLYDAKQKQKLASDEVVLNIRYKTERMREDWETAKSVTE